MNRCGQPSLRSALFPGDVVVLVPQCPYIEPWPPCPHCIHTLTTSALSWWGKKRRRYLLPGLGAFHSRNYDIVCERCLAQSLQSHVTKEHCVCPRCSDEAAGCKQISLRPVSHCRHCTSVRSQRLEAKCSWLRPGRGRCQATEAGGLGATLCGTRPFSSPMLAQSHCDRWVN